MADLKQHSASRRGFLRTTTGAIGAAGMLQAQAADTDQAIKVGLVGCGGRGTGAAAQALQADDYSVLTAVADVDQAKIDKSLATIDGRHKDKNKVRVDREHQFLGLDAFQQVIDSDVDVILLATPPGFRPMHVKAAIEAGKHVFCEKPVAIDAPGVRSVLETAKLAKEKNLSLVAGFCWRYNQSIVEIMDQVLSGAVGDLRAYYATYYTSPVKPMPPAFERPIGMTDVEWQIRNWYNFVWLCGDGLVEQAVHSVDKIAWAFGDEPPESCVAVGGTPDSRPRRQYFRPLRGELPVPQRGLARFWVAARFPAATTKTPTTFLARKAARRSAAACLQRSKVRPIGCSTARGWTMYQEEHDQLFRAIRRGEPINDGNRMATSTMLAIMGRMAAYTGQQITWDQAMQSQLSLFPENLTWDMEHEVPPLAPARQDGVRLGVLRGFRSKGAPALGPAARGLSKHAPAQCGGRGRKWNSFASSIDESPRNHQTERPARRTKSRFPTHRLRFE